MVEGLGGLDQIVPCGSFSIKRMFMKQSTFLSAWYDFCNSSSELRVVYMWIHSNKGLKSTFMVSFSSTLTADITGQTHEYRTGLRPTFSLLVCDHFYGASHTTLS